MNDPGQPLQPDPHYYTGRVYAQLEYFGHLGHAYKIPIEELYAAVAKGYDQAEVESKETPLSHSAYSSNPGRKAQLFHSHGLPSH